MTIGVREIINHWTACLLGDPRMAGRLGARFKFVVEGPGGGTWIFDGSGEAKVLEGDGCADLSLTLSAADLIDIVSSRLNPQAAFLQGKIKITGDAALALRLHALFDAALKSENDRD